MLRKAERKRSKLRSFISGITGSGKTCSALRIMSGMGGTTGMMDTENGGDLYGSEFDFVLDDIKAPYNPQKFFDSIIEFEKAKIENLIIDSFSHFWFGEGGILTIHDKVTKGMAKQNSFQAWYDEKCTPTQNKIVSAIVNYPGNVICCVRAKKAYTVEDGGKSIIKKVAMEPVQRPDVDFEFRVVLTMIHEGHLASVEKDLTHTLPEVPFQPTEEHGKLISDWLKEGSSIEEFAASLGQFKSIKDIMTKKSEKANLTNPQKAEIWTWVESLKTDTQANRVIAYLSNCSVFDNNSYVTLRKEFEDELRASKE